MKLQSIGYIKSVLLVLLIELNLTNSHNVLDVQKQVRTSTSPVKVTKDDEMCSKQARLLLDAYQMEELWALKTLDSWGKSQSGLYSGNHINFGHYEQCLQMRKDFDNSSDGIFQGQHCMIFYKDATGTPNFTSGVLDLKLPQAVHIELMRQHMMRSKHVIAGTAVCLPSFCSAAMVRSMANIILAPSNMTTTDYDQEEFCNTINILDMRSIDMFAALFFSFLLILLVVSTAYDLRMRSNNHKQKPILAAFSVYSNGLKLFETSNQAASRGIIECLHGLRALSILCVIHGHRMQTYVSFPIINKSQFREQWLRSSWASVIPTSEPMAVDTFFLLSGLLTTRSLLRKLDERGKINIGYLYLHRWLRITPVLGATIFCFLSLQRYFGDGPYNKNLTEKYAANCRKYWYTALLHIQNFVNPFEVCLSHTWYLSPDFQLFIIAPFLVYPLWRFGKYFMIILPLLALASVTFIFLVAHDHGFHLLPFFNTLDNLFKYNYYVYLPFYSRASPYLFGIMTAYVLHRRQGEEPPKLPKHLNSSLWLTSITIIFVIVVGSYPFRWRHNSPPRVVHAIFMASSPFLWSAALSWMIFACHCGFGGIVNNFLSLSMWKPLSRIGLSIYVTHILAILAVFGTQKQPEYFNDFVTTHLFLGDLGMAFGVAVLAFLTFEAPFLAIEKSFHQQKKEK